MISDELRSRLRLAAAMALATACTRKDTPVASDAAPSGSVAAPTLDAAAPARTSSLVDASAPDGGDLESLASFGRDPCPGCGMGGRLPRVHEASKGAVVIGPTDPEVTSWQPRFVACYENGLMARPNMGGRLILRLTVNDKGEVGKSDIAESELKGVVNVCVTDIGKRLHLKPGARTVLVPLFFHHEH